jgi:hypothetical protein
MFSACRHTWKTTVKVISCCVSQPAIYISLSNLVFTFYPYPNWLEDFFRVRWFATTATCQTSQSNQYQLVAAHPSISF